ncbi:Winged helix-turn-helix transcription repressor DNA-binding [Penicillium manginii]|uniref:Winged helix-turn-helix transcription repressor DNA-binding n=1 Tax=Penicillium manginii TaxID=203109 RepID=UPI0025471011|nr:Winged helix-turn-helix transcription repressor DNA-binding [Penicillium manginii]KAJ5741570.1 Winged helix-turn-helix transcription repressor DNA-binding [Penicillium manginii]
MSTFSYAQAAKGPSGSPVPAKATPTEVQNTETKTEESSNDATTESVTPASENETPKEVEQPTPTVNKDEEFTTVTSKTRSKAIHSRTSSPSVRSTKESKESDSSNTNGKADASSEKKSQDAKAEKSENGSEGPKDNLLPPKELKAAPLPSVNIWQQRKEAQDAKVKPTPVTKAASGKAEEIQQESSKSGSKKKGADASTEGSKGGKKSDGSKSRDDLPAVADASSWPTPEVALDEEKKKAQEKTDKTEKSEKSPVMRTHGKEKWMPVDYVPTAVFNTPLPPSGRGGSRRSGARGGRESGRGAAHAAGEKASSGQPAQGSAGKQATGERGQNEAGPNRAASLPAQARRSTSADVNTTEGRKTQPTERGRGGRAAEDTNANGKHTNGENVARPQKQFGKNGQANSKNPNLAVDSQAAARANDRRAESGSKSADPTGFEFNRGGRANRGGRGPFNSFNGQNSQFGNVANNGFVPKSFGGFNDRQRSHNGLTNGSQQGNRMPMRSPSLPASGNMYNVYPFPGEINTMYGYQAVNPAPMSAMPYQGYMEPFTLMNMLSMQLEYYFSVDNMCKDMFLRRQMDSQGFVPLGVIANFKRVKSLTEDFELIRHISRQLRTVEYQTGEDGVDRLRPRERWAQWILPYDQREPSAQHEGAAPAAHSGKNDENVPFNAHGLNGALPNGAQQFVPNGTGPRGSQSLSSAAPEFQPSIPQNEIANVGYPMDTQCYPAKSPPRECSSHFTPWIDPEVNDSPAACGLDPNPTIPPSICSGPLKVLVMMIPSAHLQFPANTATRGGKEKQINPTKSPLMSTIIPSISHQIMHLEVDPTKDPPKPGLPTGPPYHSWSDYLTRTFDLSLYNEFRRTALDDFFTRHVDYGFNALMWFYKRCLYSHYPIPEPVISDLVGLSRSSHFMHHAAVSEVLRTAMRSRKMEQSNLDRTGMFLNRDRQSRPAWRDRAH